MDFKRLLTHKRDGSRRDPKELAIQAAQKIADKLKAVASNRRLMAQVLAAATATAGVTAAGVVTASNISNLGDRIQQVEARPVVDTTPLQKSAQAMAKRVEALRKEAALLAATVEGIATTPVPTPTLIPETPLLPSPTLPLAPSVSPSDVKNLAGQVAETASQLSALGGQISQAAADSGSASEATKQQAEALAALSASLGETATELGAAVAEADAKSAEALAGLQTQTEALAGVSERLGTVVGDLGTLTTALAVQDSAVAALGTRADILADRADAAAESDDLIRDDLAALRARLPITFGNSDSFSDGVVVTGGFTSVGGTYKVDLSGFMFTFTNGSCNRLTALLGDGTFLAQSFLNTLLVNDSIAGSGLVDIPAGAQTFRVELSANSSDCAIAAPSVTFTKAG